MRNQIGSFTVGGTTTNLTFLLSEGNRWTYDNLNPFNSQSTVSRWVSDNSKELGTALGCGASYAFTRGLEVCEAGYDYNNGEPNGSDSVGP